MSEQKEDAQSAVILPFVRSSSCDEFGCEPDFEPAEWEVEEQAQEFEALSEKLLGYKVDIRERLRKGTYVED